MLKYSLLIPLSILGRMVFAQIPPDHISVDNSLNEGAIRGELSSIVVASDHVTGNVIVRNTTELWWKVFVNAIPDNGVDVLIDYSSLFFDPREQKYFLILGPQTASDDALITKLPPQVQFNVSGGAVFFRADRTIQAGYAALLLQEMDIIYRAVTGSRLPSSINAAAVSMIEQNLGSGPFLEAATALHNLDFIGVVGSTANLIEDDAARALIVYFFEEAGLQVTNQELLNFVPVLKIISVLSVIYDNLRTPVTDQVIFRSWGPQVIAQIDAANDLGKAPFQVSFDASRSHSTKRSIVSYSWSFGDGEAGVGIAATHTYWQPGSYIVSLTVEDDQGAANSATKRIRVYEPAIRTEMITQYTLNFETDQSPLISSYMWDFGDGQNAAGSSVQHTYSGAGELTATLTLQLINATALLSTRLMVVGPRPVYITGTYSTDHTWPATDGPFVVSSFTISAGTRLNISPGVVVKFPSSQGLSVNGALIAVGTVSDPVVFTSLKDDSYGGDTNNDGTATSPAAGDWSDIDLSSGSVMDHVLVRYGGNTGGSVYTESSPVTNSTIEYSSWYGVRVYGNATVQNNLIRNSANGVLLEGSGAPLIEANTITDNGVGITVSSGAPIVRSNTLMNNLNQAILVDLNSSSLHASGNTGSGNGLNGIYYYGSAYGQLHITQDAHWEANAGFPYVVSRFVNFDSTLTIDPGVVVKFDTVANSGYLGGQGRKTLIGTSGNPIVFTSLKDDSYGGDTNNDGTATSPAAGDWSDIDLSSGSVMDHVLVRYGGNTGGSVYTESSPVTNSTIEYSSWYGVRVYGNATVQNNLIRNSANGVLLEGSGAPLIEANTITDNGVGITVSSGTPIINLNNILGSSSYGLFNSDQAVTTNAESNWWGDPSGPLDNSDDRSTGGLYNPDGQGDRVSDHVDYDPWSGQPNVTTSDSKYLSLTILLQGYYNPAADTTRVDTITVQLRNRSAPSLEVDTSRVVTDKFGKVTFAFSKALVSADSFYVVVKHRNHLGVITSVPYRFAPGETTVVDLTDSLSKVQGTEAMWAESNGKFSLRGGDADGNGVVNAVDRNAYWRVQNGTSGTNLPADFNGDGAVNAIDRNSIWRPNNGRASYVP
jgi:parallel beta-helix repeat protein